jgi:3-dehydroquinate dehydratase-1
MLSGGTRKMKIVVSTGKRPGETNLLQYNPDLIEVRLDLVRGDIPGTVQEWYTKTEIPLILTLRSEQEGGAFSGSSDRWIEMVAPLLPYASYIDIEQQFSTHARSVREQGTGIIASYHMKRMPSIQELAAIDDSLREYGDIPKIVVTPSDEHDMIIFLSFTLHATKPVITSIMGEQFRHMRPVLPLFGSEWIFAHAGEPTAVGQYHISDLREIYSRLLGVNGAVNNQQ